MKVRSRWERKLVILQLIVARLRQVSKEMCELLKRLISILILVTALSAGFPPKSYYKMTQFPPIRYGLFENRHLPSHTAGVALLAYGSKKMGLEPEWTKNKLLWLMLGFEFYQLVQMDFKVESEYGSIEVWAYDSAGDVIFPYWIASMILAKENEHEISLNFNPINRVAVFTVNF